MKENKIIERFLTDIKRTEFLPLKFLYFMVYGGLFSLVPFLSIQARSLGIRSNEMGTIAGVIPILGIVCSAASGMVADRMGNFKIFLSFAMAASGLTSLIFIAIPVGRITYHLPDSLQLHLSCSSQDAPIVRITHPYQCDYKTNEEVDAFVTSCHFVCQNQRIILEIPSQLNDNLCALVPECSSRKNPLFGRKQPFSSSGSDLFNQSLIQRNVIPIRLRISESNNGTMLQTKKLCPSFSKIGFNTTAYFLEESNSTEDDCLLQCTGQTEKADLCSNDVTVVEKNPVLTITLYILCMILQQITLISSLPLFEGATIAILKERNGDIGLQRLYSNIGKLVMTPISGILINSFSTEDEKNFKPAIYTYCIINFLSAFSILFIDLKFKKPANDVTREFRQVLANFEILTFLFVGFIVGVTTGVLDTFLFWLLDDMGASTSLMGITVTVGSVFGVFILMFATTIINKIGNINTLTIGLVFFVFRLVGYSLITNPWWAMPFEAMESFTTALYGVAQASYTAQLSTPTTIVSLQGLSMGLFHGLGRGMGSMIGGFMADGLGLRVTYRIMAAVCACLAVIYPLLNIFVFKKTRHDTTTTTTKTETSNTDPTNQATQVTDANITENIL